MMTSLPTHRGDDGSWICQKESISRQYKFLRRIVRLKFNQMDFQFALWQMVYLMTNPGKVYKNSRYRKDTKNQWARDDPAFLVLLAVFLCGSSILFAIILKLSVPGFFQFLLWVIFIDCIGVGLVIASIMWFVCNRVFKVRGGGFDQNVEFGYAFDVHCNAFFPLLVILHVLQPILWHVMIDGDSRLATVLGNSMWMSAMCIYVYISMIGYAALPFLKGTEKLLYCVPIILIMFTFSVLINWNWGRRLIHFYKFRIGE